MRKIPFTKMVASGNDFIVIEKPSAISRQLSAFAKKVCDRKFGIGADGLLVVASSKRADRRMRIFNADGSEAEMCGNGARCFALYCGKDNLCFETKAGIINACVHNDTVKINLTSPKGLQLGIPIVVSGRKLHVNFIDTGVPHTIVFVEGIDAIPVKDLGREIRYHKQFAPRGTNVNFVEITDNNAIRIRTYERGVEDETLACGTGSVASSIISSMQLCKEGNVRINVLTQGGEVLKVYFTKKGNHIESVWLEGRARIICKGDYYHV